MAGGAQVQAFITGDPARWRLLGLVRSLRLPDCWIGAGFVRNALWDRLHGRDAAPPPGDVDVVRFDPERADPPEDQAIQATLHDLAPTVRWSVKNQARMHARNGDAPHASAAEAMRHWPETATAVAVRRGADDQCEVAAPFGLGDLLGLVLRPTPGFAASKRHVFDARVREKRWLSDWPGLQVACRQATPSSSHPAAVSRRAPPVDSAQPGADVPPITAKASA